MLEVDSPTLETGDHVVHFYDEESLLVGTVGAYLAAALGDGGIAIALTTADRRSAFRAQLEATGVDVDQAVGDGTLVWIDATAVAEQCVVGGEVRPDAFGRLAAQVVRDAVASGRPVRVYGELVAVLWESGDVAAAIEIEDLWHRLIAQLPFSLLCAYHAAAVAGPEHVVALEEVCHLHSSVLPHAARRRASARAPVAVSRRFPCEPDSAGAARRFVAETLREWNLNGAVLDDFQLAVSELATNAVIHARTPFSIVLRKEREAVRVSVRDASHDPPRPVEPDPRMITGRGVRVVSALAEAWGYETSRDGKTVWARISTSEDIEG